ncbi:MAG: tetratricopeptide repeat protein [Nitrospirae bacterium]|nr:tetratricopeptide repeat protein [Nitrospirota bacterium]MBI5696598.1 tetratricopeptide repeat protein [Nitrospirota bacterium]
MPLLAGFSPPSGPTDKANEAFAAGKYDDALEGYRKAAEDDPDKAAPHYNLGGAYYKKGEYEKALSER